MHLLALGSSLLRFEDTHEQMLCNQIPLVVNQMRLHVCEENFVEEVDVGFEN